MKETDPFVPWLEVEREDPRPGPLSGLRLAVKDNHDVAGLPTGAGNPRWLETHRPAERDADTVAGLRAAGAALVGKVHTDELAYSVGGTNFHYGAPVNPAAPGHTCGGSSCGSASAVATGAADLGLGSDTAGSIRVPASYTGLYGLRPSHSRVSLAGVVPLAPSFDVPGLLARDLATLRAGNAALLAGGPGGDDLAVLLLPADIWAAVSQEVRDALAATLEALTALLPADRAALFDSDEQWTAAHQAFSTVQAGEAWAAHGEWIERERPTFGAGIGGRFRRAAEITPDEAATAAAGLRETADRLARRLAGGAVLAVPSTPTGAPAIDEPSLDRSFVIRFTFLAPAAGAPGLALPAGRLGELPLGLSLIAAPGADEALLDLAAALPPESLSRPPAG